MTVLQCIGLGFMMALTPSLIVFGFLMWRAKDDDDVNW